VKQKNKSRAFAVLPYSGKDPICIVAEYTDIGPESVVDFGYGIEENLWHKTYQNQPIPGSWWRIRLLNAIWDIDKRFPSLRRLLQRSLNFSKMKTWKVITDPYDLDPKYHQNMGTSNDEMGILLWAQKPTYTSINMAISCKPEDVEDVVKFAIKTAYELKYGFLTSFIGCRELKDGSDIPWAINYGGPRTAMDFYCLVKDVKYMESLQKAIQENFDVILHKAKSI